MIQTRKTRIPSVPYLEQKIAQIGAIEKPTKEDILLLAQYKKLIEQRINLVKQ
jgi:hypothetical protein